MSSRGSSPDPTTGTSPTGSNSGGVPPTRTSYANGGRGSSIGGGGDSPVSAGGHHLTPGGGFMVSRTSNNQRQRHDSTTSPPMGPSTPTPVVGGLGGQGRDTNSPLGPENNCGLPDFALLPPSGNDYHGSGTPPPTTHEAIASGSGSSFAAGDVRKRRNSSSAGTSPVPVPLITPKYQRKDRQFNEMNLTDTSEGAERSMSATEMLRQRSVEALTIRSGKVVYGDTVDYHAYSLFKHGKHQYHTQSVGYSSEGDLVMNKEEISSSSDAEPGKFDRQVVHVTNAVCLDPYKRRALTDDEARKKRLPNGSRLKKYPGVKAPKNRKARNRLKNDHMANEFGREIFEKMRERQMAIGDPHEDEDNEGYHKPTPALFPSFQGKRAKKGQSISASDAVREERNAFLDSLMHKEPDQIDRLLKSRGVKVSPALRATAADKNPDGADMRFLQLSQRLKDELKRAVKTSEQLIIVINELEMKFGKYILDCEKDGVSKTPPVELFLHDSYCRLLCHGVAGFYKLLSSSEDAAPSLNVEDGVKRTLVQHPKVTAKKPLVELPLQSLMGFLTGKPALATFSLDGENPSSMVGGGVMAGVGAVGKKKFGGTPSTSDRERSGHSPLVDISSTKSSPTDSDNTGGKKEDTSSPTPSASFKDGEEDPVYPMSKQQQKKLKKLRKGVNVPMQQVVESSTHHSQRIVLGDDEWEDVE